MSAPEPPGQVPEAGKAQRVAAAGILAAILIGGAHRPGGGIAEARERILPRTDERIDVGKPAADRGFRPREAVDASKSGELDLSSRLVGGPVDDVDAFAAVDGPGQDGTVGELERIGPGAAEEVGRRAAADAERVRAVAADQILVAH